MTLSRLYKNKKKHILIQNTKLRPKTITYIKYTPPVYVTHISFANKNLPVDLIDTFITSRAHSKQK